MSSTACRMASDAVDDPPRERNHAEIARAILAHQREVDRRPERQRLGAPVDDRALDAHDGHVSAPTGGRARGPQPAPSLVPRRDPSAVAASAQMIWKLLLRKHPVNYAPVEGTAVGIRRVVDELRGCVQLDTPALAD